MGRLICTFPIVLDAVWGTGDEQLSIKDGGRLAESVAVAMDKRQIPAVAETGRTGLAAESGAGVKGGSK